MASVKFNEVNWQENAYCWRCEKLTPLKLSQHKKVCQACGQLVMHGPRSTIIASTGRTLLAFDADALHYRIAACLSGDSFINESLVKYDLTKDPIWKPHVQNCAALFQVTPAQAVEMMNAEAPQYTFAKNFIYMLLNGGEAPALANAAAMTGLKLTISQVATLVKNWLQKAVGFDKWRESLLKEAGETGQLELACGRRRRFYDLRMKEGAWIVNSQSKKEIYNFPLIGTEVTFMNQVINRTYERLQESQWQFVYHGHDGFMLEGPDNIGSMRQLTTDVCAIGSVPFEIKPGLVMKIPFAAKVGRCWATMEKA
jgi:hypothetical protein